MPTYRIDFHAHCNCDPIDALTYSGFDVIDRAVEYGIDAIAITPHMTPFHERNVMEYARKRGVLLIPGVEKLVEGFEVLLINITPGEIPSPCTFADVQKLKETKGDQLLVMAPHPFYPHPKCVGKRLDEYRDLFDAVEYSHFHFFGWNPNRKAMAWAKKNAKPIVATSDAHRLEMIGRNFTEVDAPELSVSSIFQAIRSGQCKLHSPSLDMEHIILFAVGVVLAQEIAHRFFSKVKPQYEK